MKGDGKQNENKKGSRRNREKARMKASRTDHYISTLAGFVKDSKVKKYEKCTRRIYKRFEAGC